MDIDVSPLSFSSLSLPLLSSLPLPSLILSLSPAGSLYASMDGKCGKKQEVCRRHLHSGILETLWISILNIL